MRGLGDQANVPVCVSVCAVISADGHEPGVFPRGAGVGLEGDGVEAGDLGQLVRELGKKLLNGKEKNLFRNTRS